MTKVTIDLDEAPIPELRDASPNRVLRYAGYVRSVGNGGAADVLEWLAEHLPKPKPEEPTGLFAVVEDREGVRWVNFHDRKADRTHFQPWVPHFHPRGDRSAEYSAIDAVKVLSPGV